MSNYRCRSLAKCWLKRSLETAREMGLASMLLESAVYAAGFSKLGQRQSYYRPSNDKIDAVVMRIEI